MKAAKIAPPNKDRFTTEDPETADRFNRVLAETAAALSEAGLRHVFIGGIAASGLGRPRSTHDIDVFVRPEDAERALRALAARGFKTEKTDPVWLYKAWKEGVLVDVIFKSKGEIYLDPEMLERISTQDYHGQRIPLVAPEDLIIIKALAHSEVTPNHWHDALALLSQAQIDWDYLIRRARKAPRRVLSLLLYAQSSDLHVPKSVVDQLYVVIFGDLPPGQMPGPGTSAVSGAQPRPYSPLHPVPQRGPAPGAPPVAGPGRAPLRPVTAGPGTHQVARIREHLASDPRLGELDIQVEAVEDGFLLRGEVNSQERRENVERIVRELYPASRLDNRITVSEFTEPGGEEEVK